MSMKKAANNHGIWARLREQPARGEAWLDLAQGYAANRLPWHLAHARLQAGRCGHGAAGPAAPMARSVEMAGEPAACWVPDEVLNQAPGSWKGWAPVGAALRVHLATNPGDWLSWLYLARCLELGNAPAQVQREAVVQALACEPMAGETGHALARWRLQGGDPAGALGALQAVLAQAPQRHGSWLMAAEALMQLGREAEARHAFEQAGRSQNPRVLELVAGRLFAVNYVHEALQVREAVARLEPDNAQAWNALGQLQKTLFQGAAARQSLERALSLQPDMASAQETLREIAHAGASREEFDQRLAAFEQGDIKPNGEGMKRLLMMSLYQSHLGAERVAKLHRDVGDALQAQVNGAWAPRAGPAARPRQGRRLRVGYVSGDLHRQHPVNIFALPVLRRHDRARLETFVYHTGTFVDGYTRQAKACVEHWREAQPLSDVALHRMVLDDRIDVLVDLGGHTNTARLGVFAMRAAPVQITYLGYPHSTGLRCMDWIVADAVVAPKEQEPLFTERVGRVSGCVFTWSADEEDYPLPASTGGPTGRPVTFGCFNNLMKVSDDVLRVWGRVLGANPGSRLLLKAPVLGDPDVARRTLRRLEEAGVAPGRVEMRGPTELSLMMQEYGAVDIALDPFPYNGGTTSLQALWMGCPMVAMAGRNFVSRMGMSFLTQLGCTEWIAGDADAYVRIATRLAAQITERGWNRAAFRQRMLESPLCDVERQTRDLEALYEQAHDAALSARA